MVTMNFQDKCINSFLDYWNNYLTIDYFAKCNNITKQYAERLIDLGREAYNNRVTVLHFINRVTNIKG